MGSKNAQRKRQELVGFQRCSVGFGLLRMVEHGGRDVRSADVYCSTLAGGVGLLQWLRTSVRDEFNCSLLADLLVCRLSTFLCSYASSTEFKPNTLCGNMFRGFVVRALL